MRRLVPITAIAAVVAILGTTAYAQSADNAPEFSSAILDSTGQLTISFDNAVDFTQLDYSKLYIRERGESTGGVSLHLYNVTYNGTTYEHSSTIEKDGGGDGTGEREFHAPQDVAVNGTGHIFVADTDNNRIQILSPDGAYINSTGSAGTGAGEFRSPRGIAVNGTGHIFVADFHNNRVHILHPDGTPAGYVKNYTGPDGNADNGFNQPHGVTIDYKGNIITNENNNDRVQIFHPDGTFKTQFGSGPDCANGKFNSARDTTTLPDGRLFVTGDSCHNVQVFFPPDYSDDASDVISIGTQNNLRFVDNPLTNPFGITHDVRGMIVFTERTQDQIKTLDPSRISPDSPNDAITDETLGTGTAGSGDYEFDAPNGLEADRHGRLFVADTDNDRIQVFVLASADVRLSLNSTDLAAVHGMTDPVLDIGTGAARTVGGTDVKPSIDNTITILDSTAPEFELAKLYNTTGEFSIYLDETVNPFRTDPTELHIREQGQSEGGVTLSTNPVILDTYNFDSSIATTGTDTDGPSGVAVDSDGDIIMADSVNHCVRIFNTDGTNSTIGTCGTSGLANDKLNFPRGVAVNGDDHIFVADTANCRVQVFNQNGGLERTLGRPTADSDKCADSFKGFNSPRGVAFNSTGHIFVVDKFHRVTIFNPDAVHNDFALKEITYRVGGGITRTDNTDGFNSPQGVATNGTHVFVADTANHRIKIHGSNGAYVGQFGSEGGGNEEFKSPHGVAIDGSGRIIVADTGNHRVQILHPNGSYANEFGSMGTDDGSFMSPRGVTVHGDDILVADTFNHRIQRFTPLDGSTYIIKDVTPHLLKSVGSFGTANGTFNEPYSVAIDGTGRIIVADTKNNRVQIFNPDGTHVRNIVTSGLSDGALDKPRGVAVNSTHIFVSDKNRIQIFDLDGVFTGNITTVGQSGNLDMPHGIMINETNHIFVADTNQKRVLIYHPNGTNIDGIRYDSDITDPFFGKPDDVTEGAGMIAVADTTNHRIRIFDTENLSHVNTIGKAEGGGDANIGNGTGEFSYPRGVAIDSTGRIWVADTGNHRIQVLYPDGTPIEQFGSEGQRDVEFYKPRDIIIDGDRVWVADTANHRVQSFVFSSDGLSFSLTSRALSMVNDMQTPELDIDQFAIHDTAGNPIERSHDNKITTDTTSPMIGLVSTVPDSGTVGYNGTITIMLSASESGLSIHPNSTINNMPIKNDTLLYDSNTGNYTITYTVSESDARVRDNQNIQANIILYDTARNPSDPITDISDNDAPGIDSTKAAVTLDHATSKLDVSAGTLFLNFSHPVNYLTGVSDLQIIHGDTVIPLSSEDVTLSAKYEAVYGFSSSIDGLNRPRGVDVNDMDHILVADTNNNRVQIFYPNGTIAQTITEESGGFDRNLADFDPYDVAVNGTGHILVADFSNNLVRIFDPNGTHVDMIGTGTWNSRTPGDTTQPQSVTFDNDGNVIVTEQLDDRVQIFYPNGTHLETIGSTNTREFSVPHGAVVLPDGRLFVTDTNNHRIRILNSSYDFTGQIGGDRNVFDKPYGITIDIGGMILVTDQDDRIVILDTGGNITGTFGSPGSGDGQLDNPAHLTTDSAGRVIVADMRNDRVQIFEPYSSELTFSLAGDTLAAVQAIDEPFVAIPVGNLTTLDRLHLAASDRFPRLMEDGDDSDDDDVTDTRVSVAVAVPEQVSSTVHRSGGGGGGGIIISGTPILPSPGEATSVLHRVYWETSNDMITLYVVTSAPDGSEPYVYLRTPDSGTITAKVSDSQPYPDRILYEAEISTSNNFAQVYVDDVSQYILLDAPKGDVPVTLYDESDTSLVEPAMDPVMTKPDPVIEPETPAEPEPVEPVIQDNIPDPIQDVEPVQDVVVDPEPTTNNEQITDDDINGCLIATAAYGTELAPQVQLLRELRDGSLLQTHSGTAFMGAFNNIYYAFSPAVSDLQRENPIFRESTKLLLTPMLYTLNIMNIADDEISVLGLGLSVIALNIGMYIVSPAFAGYAMYKHRKSFQ